MGMTEKKLPAGSVPGAAALAALIMIFSAQLMAGQKTVLVDSYKKTQELLNSVQARELGSFTTSQDKSGGPSSKRQLTKYEKCILGVFYPDQTLDGASVVNGYPALVGYDPVMTAIVHISLARKYGVTIGREMFFPSDQLDTRTLSGMSWIAHEMKHVAQATAFGPPQDFLQGYTSTVAGGLLSGDSVDNAYLNSPFETDARAVASAFKTLFTRENGLASALAGENPDKDVCDLANSNFAAYKAVLARELGTRERTTYKFKIGSFPLLFLKTVTYTFYND
jgi:hypothetical protein